MTIKKLLILILIILLAIFFSSCREYEELEGIGIVIATALDFEDDKVVATVEVTIPINRAEESRDSNSIILQEAGDTVVEAMRNITLNFDRKLYFSHNTVIIIGEDFARKGIVNYLDLFVRHNQTRETAFLVVAKGSKAYEIIGINSSLVGTTGEYLSSIFDNVNYSLKARSLTVNEFFKYYYDRETPLLGLVEKRDITEIEPVTGEKKNKSILDVRGGGPFYKDKLIGYYSPEEMIGFNFIVDEVKEGIIVFEPPKEFLVYSEVFSPGGDYMTYEIIKNKTKISADIVNGQPYFNISVNIIGLILEDTVGMNTNILEVVEAVKKACEDQVKEYITMTLDKAQELKADSFGINHIFYSSYPKEYNKISDSWHDRFSRMDYSVDVNVDIIRTGLVNTPANVLKGEDY